MDGAEARVRWAAGGFSLAVDVRLQAPWTAVFGPSGAGKTSLLRLLAGLARPDEGVVTLDGRTLVDTAAGVWVGPAERGIGWVSQRPALFPHMNVTENVAFGAAAKERVAAVLALFEAGHLARRRPRELSGGEQQRVALARALAPGPRLLLLDEPFAGLDGALKETAVGALRACGVSVLLVTHDVAEAFQSDEVLVMEQGRITAQGPAEVVLARQRQDLLHRLG